MEENRKLIYQNMPKRDSEEISLVICCWSERVRTQPRRIISTFGSMLLFFLPRGFSFGRVSGALAPHG